MNRPKTLSIVIPVFNEANFIGVLLDRVVKADTTGLQKEIIVVNDGSSDATHDVLEQLNKTLDFKLISYPRNHGKGYAMRQGIAAATGDFIMVQDADLEYSPTDYPSLLAPVLSGEAKVVYGSRRLSEKNKRYSAFSFFLGGILVSIGANFLYGSKLTDVTTGYKVFSKEVLDKIELKCDGFEFCEEVTAKVLNLHYSIQEVPISYNPRPIEQGKKIKWKDGIFAVWTLFRLAPLRHFLIAAAILISAFAIFFPFRSVALDEHDYFANAGNIIHNTLRMTCATAQNPSQFPVADYCIYKYNLGTSLFFVPAAYLGIGFAFITTFLVFLLAVFVFTKFLKYYKLDAKFIYMFAFYPPFIYYSRTLYSEIFSMTLLLAGSYFLVTHKKLPQLLWSGLLLGFSVFTRYTNVFPVAILVVAFCFNKNPKVFLQKLFMIFLGALPFIAVFLFINWYLYAAPFRSGYFFSGEENLRDWNQVIIFAPVYLLLTLIMYPGMLLSAFSFPDKVLKYATLVSVFFIAVFYAAFPGGNKVFEGRVLDLILGMRYLLPIIPFLILSYAKSCSLLLTSKIKQRLYYGFIGILIAGVYLLSLIHWLFLVSLN